MKVRADQIETLRAGIDVLVRVLKITDRLSVPDSELRLNPPDTQALLFIARHPQCISSAIGELLGVAPTTTTTIIDRLVRQDLVLRTRTEANRRVVLLALTPLGEGVVEKILEEQRRHCERMLDALPAEARPRFVANLQTIAEHLEASSR